MRHHLIARIVELSAVLDCTTVRNLIRVRCGRGLGLATVAELGRAVADLERKLARELMARCCRNAATGGRRERILDYAGPGLDLVTVDGEGKEPTS
jgi:hypothetical protein